MWERGAAWSLRSAAWPFIERGQRPPEVRYTQLTDFTDSAVAPALSTDGQMVAFIRGGNGFLTSDQIYVKMLPNGEAKLVTDDERPKYGLAFSPDGSEIAYTVLERSGFSTYEVSALGGEPHLLLKNAAGLVWLDPERLLFSEIRSGIHMGVVSATVTGAGLREIYFPAHERGMAHYSIPSPDRLWALVVEMNGNGDWAPCRLVGAGWPEPAKADWTDGCVHLCGVVAGWGLDVFHCRGGRTEPHLAAALSGRRAGANHLWANGRRWSGGAGEGWGTDHLGGSA
jgi:hypothetical protein